MEFKTSTGGDTTLAFDAVEQQELAHIAELRGETLDQVRKQFELILRQHPMAAFEGVCSKLMPPPRLSAAAADDVQVKRGRQSLNALIDMEMSKVGQKMREAGSIQVEATLRQAYATLLLAAATLQASDEQRGRKR